MRTPIRFEGADGTTQHSPLIKGRIGGIETLLVLDTGSEVHLLTKELVDRLGLSVEEGEEGTDHSGATMPSWSVEDVELEAADLRATLHGVVAIPAPAPFHGWGIGGILSPQHLHSSAYTVIDLATNELRLDEDPALGETTLVLERDRGFTSVVVRAAVEPHAEIPTMLNTGGKRTEFSARGVPGMAGSVERIGGGVSGADVMGATVGEATLLVAGKRLPVASLAVREEMHDPQGLVGMDVLRGTVLAVAADLDRPVLWRIP